ncbi:MAG: class I SAM-dependent methyltransferase [Vicinamibacteria bacterium]|nr:class I SAM-dependent methyltransferase [Vicinamibacteria bacterium]
MDISDETVRIAALLNTGLEYRVGDMRQLDIPDASLAGVISFYSIVHFELGTDLCQIRRA